MDLYLLDSNFNSASPPIRLYTSFIWDEQYYTYGTFEAEINSKYLKNILNAEYMYNKESKECAMIELIEYNEHAKTVSLSGVMLERLLNDRVSEVQIAKNGNLEDVIYELVSYFCLTGNRTVPLLTLAPKQGFTDTYQGVMEQGVYLDDWLYETLKSYEMSYKITFDQENHQLVFGLYKGKDLRQNNNKAGVVFSTNAGNISNIIYTKDLRNHKNFAYVSDSDNFYVITIDKINSKRRKETFISTSIKEGTLHQRGEEVLSETVITECADGEMCTTGGTLKYRTSYNLGDLIHVKIGDTDIVLESRITSVTSTYEDNAIYIDPKFGDLIFDNAHNMAEIINKEMKK